MEESWGMPKRTGEVKEPQKDQSERSEEHLEKGVSWESREEEGIH